MNKRELERAGLKAKKNAERIMRAYPSWLQKEEAHLLKKIRKGSNDPFDRLLSLYAFMDKINKFIIAFVPCKQGCSYCCSYPVSIYELEIQNIEKTRGISRAGPKVRNYHGIPCPFLKNGSCDIYSCRPFVCMRE